MFKGMRFSSSVSLSGTRTCSDIAINRSWGRICAYSDSSSPRLSKKVSSTSPLAIFASAMKAFLVPRTAIGGKAAILSTHSISSDDSQTMVPIETMFGRVREPCAGTLSRTDAEATGE